ncbi:MAG: gliding motility-associated C-terminal domain-containing protein, partial [Flavobacteriales bacterium]|nr:gliding motility-associated C-terminal domain-containing protein [Flavobacteriales bacterium]
PNAFTPNRDGKNETWRVYKENIYDFHLQVFNRWNEVVFETYTITDEWNGLLHNTESKCPVGTYLYKVTYRENANKQLQQELGEVHIVK